jgi:soluble lytic murein transglycosylase-like protein
MRFTAAFATPFAIVLLTCAPARAQEAGTALTVQTSAFSSTNVARVPMMVVHDAPLPVIKPAPLAILDPRTKRKAATGAKAIADSLNRSAATTAAPKTMIIAAQPVTPTGGILTNLTSADILHMTSTGNPTYDGLVMKSAAKFGVDPNLVMAVMHQESGFNPRARSYKGASGLMQLMPATARRFGVENIYDPAQNIDAGTRYLRFLLDTFNGDVELALAGYNAGENAVVNSGYQIPRYRETQNYVRTITAKYGKTKSGRGRTIAAAKAVAPTAMSFSAAASTRFSNNY